MSMTQGYDLQAELIEEFRAIVNSDECDDKFRVHLLRAKLNTFDRERNNMIREHEDYRREINGPR